MTTKAQHFKNAAIYARKAKIAQKKRKRYLALRYSRLAINQLLKARKKRRR